MLYTTIFLLLFSDAAKIILFSTTLVLCMNLIVMRNKELFILIIAIIVSLLSYYIIFYLVQNNVNYRELGILENSGNIIDYLPEYALYVGTGLLSAWVNIKAFVHVFNFPPVLIYILGLCVLSFYIYALYLFYRKKMYHESLLPAILIMHPLVFACSVSIFRFQPDIQSALNGNVPRYYLTYCLGIVGVIWVLVMLINKEKNIIYKYITYTLCCIIFLSQFISTAFAWKYTSSRHNLYAHVYSIMIKNANGNTSLIPPRSITGSNYPEPYYSGLIFLKKNKLNIFSNAGYLDKYR
jgi:hypothetical protein